MWLRSRVTVHVHLVAATAVGAVRYGEGGSCRSVDSIPAHENSDDPVELHSAIDLSKVLPADSELAQCEGSLTTPPCSEGVRWNLFLTPISLSSAQIAAFTAVYPHNNRPVQPMNGRTLAESRASER